jgi:hypothetical protein
MILKHLSFKINGESFEHWRKKARVPARVGIDRAFEEIYFVVRIRREQVKINGARKSASQVASLESYGGAFNYDSRVPVLRRSVVDVMPNVHQRSNLGAAADADELAEPKLLHTASILAWNNIPRPSASLFIWNPFTT